MPFLLCGVIDNARGQQAGDVGEPRDQARRTAGDRRVRGMGWSRQRQTR